MIAADLVSGAFEKTKKTFFPVKTIYWLKLGFISLIAGGISSSNTQQIVGDLPGAEEFISQNLTLIFSIIAILFLFGILWSIISYIFKFMLIDGVIKKKDKIWKMFADNMGLGIRFFFFNLILGLIMLMLIAIPVVPIILYLISGPGMTAQIISILLLLGIILFFMLLVFIPIILVINTMMIYDMYIRKKTAISSFRRMFFLLKRKLGEVIVYWLILFGLGILGGLVSLVVAFITIIPFGIIGFILFLAITASEMAMMTAIITGVLIAVPILLIYLYLLSVFTLPIKGFFIIYSNDFVNLMSKKYLIKK